MSVQVAVVIGSKSDLPLARDSGLFKILTDVGAVFEASIISAHRNPEELDEFCQTTEAEVIIAAAGMAAALPGDIASRLKFDRPVIGVPLPSSEFPNAVDAMLTIARMPPGCPVILPGIGTTGLVNAAILALQILAKKDETIKRQLAVWFKKNAKPAQRSLKKEDLDGSTSARAGDHIRV